MPTLVLLPGLDGTGDFFQPLLEALGSMPAKTIRSRLEAVADCDVREALASIRLPIMCLVARHDRLIPKAAARLIQRQAPAASLVEIDAPHCLLQCEPQQAARQISAFLRALELS